MRKNEIKVRFAKKSFGQNFLVDPNYISKIITALDPLPDETIIEIGAGRGALTEKLAESGADIIAIEFDKDLVPFLREKFEGFDNLQIVEINALTADFNKLTAEDLTHKTKLVANLPYNISTAILQRLIEQREVFSEMILMFQREVVERISAEPGNKERGFLTVLVEAFLQTEKLFDVPPNAFRPIPKVWSSVVRLRKKADEELKIGNEKLFKEIISIAFKQKRKTILNNLKNSHDILYKTNAENADLSSDLEKIHIDPKRRAETLTFDEWQKITAFFDKNDDRNR